MTESTLPESSGGATAADTVELRRSGPLRWVFPVWVAGFLAFWLWALLTGPGFGLFESHWPFSVMMIFGSMIAGFTPEGGGAVAYPILNLYFSITPDVARDFSLAIQSVGMVSAAIYILTRKARPWRRYRHIPVYALFNMLGFVFMSAIFHLIPFKVMQMLFVSLAVAFIAAYMLTRGSGTETEFSIERSSKFMILSAWCFAGGCAAALFGTGSDMLIYIALTCYYRIREKESTDISIILMATMSLFGIAYRGLVMGDISPEVFDMWLVAAPVVVLFGPLGNKLLQYVSKEKMLWLVVMMNSFNFLYFGWMNPAYMVAGIILMTSLLTLFIATFHLNRPGARPL